ncbi:hypothetical protein [Metapseudomonas otitidis]|uniref:hypothetical protein n=1 Tax=Metapseudomonas otitidis TaxID=319939 RepID=UPI00244C85FB|nr:hypothetical protein [Pseudomonas otitidis]MDG9785349.1 hypothetical protein [Pseudomonas otitidis]
MTDRELLEAAARAIGYRQHGYHPTSGLQILGEPLSYFWNPITYIGDRYRLLKALKMAIDFEIFEVIYLVDGNICAQSFRDDGDDARAVLRAAAEIGRNM